MYASLVSKLLRCMCGCRRNKVQLALVPNLPHTRTRTRTHTLTHTHTDKHTHTQSHSLPQHSTATDTCPHSGFSCFRESVEVVLGDGRARVQKGSHRSNGVRIPRKRRLDLLPTLNHSVCVCVRMGVSVGSDSARARTKQQLINPLPPLNHFVRACVRIRGSAGLPTRRYTFDNALSQAQTQRLCNAAIRRYLPCALCDLGHLCEADHAAASHPSRRPVLSVDQVPQIQPTGVRSVCVCVCASCRLYRARVPVSARGDPRGLLVLVWIRSRTYSPLVCVCVCVCVCECVRVRVWVRTDTEMECLLSRCVYWVCLSASKYCGCAAFECILAAEMNSDKKKPHQGGHTHTCKGCRSRG